MTGDDVKLSVQRYLARETTYDPNEASLVLAALDGCIVLTAEDEAVVRDALQRALLYVHESSGLKPIMENAIVLLTDQEASDE